MDFEKYFLIADKKKLELDKIKNLKSAKKRNKNKSNNGLIFKKEKIYYKILRKNFVVENIIFYKFSNDFEKMKKRDYYIDLLHNKILRKTDILLKIKINGKIINKIE